MSHSTSDEQMNRNESSTIELPAWIERETTERIQQTEFESTDEYVAFVLEQLFAQIDRETPAEKTAPDTDTDDVEERLESLGYL